MAKKKKKNSKNRYIKAKQALPQSKKRSKFHLLTFIAGFALVLVGAYYLYSGENPEPRTPELPELKNLNAGLRENRPTLSPQRFSGTFRLAYEVARAIPDVLDQLYCYCRCQENLGHKNPLSCYVDTHAST